MIIKAIPVSIPVSFEKETVWLSANQMALLFDRDEKTIRKHIQRAIEHDVVLFDVDTLAELLAIQTTTPLKLSDLSLVFKQSGKADLSVLIEEQRRGEITGLLVKSIMKCLVDEAQDEVTLGKLSVRDIYRSLRNVDEIRGQVTVDNIQQVLEFLASPIIGCVGKERDYYLAKGSLQDTARMFDYLKKICLE